MSKKFKDFKSNAISFKLIETLDYSLKFLLFLQKIFIIQKSDFLRFFANKKLL